MTGPIVNGVFTHAALAALKDALDASETPSEFFGAVDAIAADPSWTLEYPFPIGDIEELSPRRARRGGQSAEADNARLVYEHIGPIVRAQASDPRLWTHLAFVEYRSYMEQRWPLTEEGWRNRVSTRWLLTSGARGALLRHGVSRLWWVADLTMDPEGTRPLSVGSDEGAFAYTQAALAREDALLAIFDRDAGQNVELMFALWEHVVAEPARSHESYVRELMKEVRREGALRELAIFDHDQCVALVESMGALVAERL